MRMRVLIGLIAAGVTLAAPAAALAQRPVSDRLPSPRPIAGTTRVRVGPRTIETRTDALVGFGQPLTTGDRALSRAHFHVGSARDGG